MATKFTFKYVPGFKFPGFENKDTDELLMKWSLRGRIKMQTFMFDQPYADYLKTEFITCFFKDPEVVSNLLMLSAADQWMPLGAPAYRVEYEQLKTSATSMTFFNRLYAFKAVREDGTIVLCFDEYLEDGTIISDELRKVLQMEESENYPIFNEDDRSEFLFWIFYHLCVGGKICQPENNVKPYLDTTKAFYKDFVSVIQEPETHQLKVISSTFKIKAYNAAHEVYYPSDPKCDQAYCYLTVCPSRRLVKIFYYKYGVGQC